MAGKEPDNFKEKIRKLLGINKPPTPLTMPRTQTKEIIFTTELLREIGPDSPANNRLKTIRELSEIVKTKRLEENAMEALWASISDLLPAQVPAENRHVALLFLRNLLEGQLNNLGMLRGHFFRVIQKLSCPEDLQDKLEMFTILSENGRNLLDFEEETGVFLCKWMPDVMAAGRIEEFLCLLVQVIKFNAAYLDEEVVACLVQQTCMIPNQARSQEEQNLKHCLEVLDAVVRYSYLPSSSLHPFIAALCHMVNKPKFCEESWELMRKLLGTHLGHSSIYTMCCMLQDRCPPVDPLLLRGAVFFIGMALWGSRLVPTLKHTPSSVLPSFLQALSTNNEIVAYEVVLSIQRLVKKYGKDSNHITWEIILDIIEVLLRQLEMQDSMEMEVHDVLTTIEELHEKGHFMGSVSRFFKIIELCVNKRSEKSVSTLIDYHAESIHPGKENWIQNLNLILEKYFKQETRTEIRKKALDVLSFILSINKHVYESDLMENVVIPQLGHIENDPDPEVRRVAVEMLLMLAKDCNTSDFMDIIVLVEKLLRRPMHAADGTDVHRLDEGQIVDIKTAVLKLVEVFKSKLYQIPSSHCLKVYELLIGHMTTQYTQKYTSNSACIVRKAIMEMLLQLRSDSLHRLGLADRPSDRPSDSHFAYSHYIVCKESEDKSVEVPSSPTAVHSSWFQLPSVISYTETFKLFIMCLEHEFDWDVLKCVLENLPLVLQNKTLILSADQQLVDNLCHKLCSMVNDRSLGFPEKLQSLPTKFTRSDFHTYIFPVLAAMVTYHDYLDRTRQRELIKCLEFGLVSKCAKVCVSALRISSLEMQDVVMRLLPSVLLSLSKISATISMAIPVLAFLSSIVRQQNLYINFVEDQYMSVFAIALPYTNPFKFSHYTVSLAHHVIAIWFIRCRLPFRKAFVKFIQKSLKANVLQQFEENSVIHLQNQDSRDRSRSGSYTEGAQSRFRRSTGASMLQQRERRPLMNEKMSQFHKELTETCTDVMARYTFGNFAAMPHRSHLVQFLLSGGQSQTWLHGNRIITITTSGGGAKVGNTGLCEKCLALYQESYESKPPPQPKHDRRRHKSAACLSLSHTHLSPSVISTDESEGRLRWSRDDMSLPSDDVLFSADRDEVGVQTGTSLSGSWLENESLEALLLGIKSQNQEKRAFCTNQCNCWCTNWAEILIRGASGNISWMMRIENETGYFASQQDLTLPDLTLLFAPLRQKPAADVDSGAKIDSESLGEDEYETLYSQHFPEDTSDDASSTLKLDKSETGHEDSEQLQDMDQLPSVTLRKSTSSPSLLMTYSEESSPKEFLSDVAISPASGCGFPAEKPIEKKDSEILPVKETKSIVTKRRSNSFSDQDKDTKAVSKLSKDVMMLNSDKSKEKSGKECLSGGKGQDSVDLTENVSSGTVRLAEPSLEKVCFSRQGSRGETISKSDRVDDKRGPVPLDDNRKIGTIIATDNRRSGSLSSISDDRRTESMPIADARQIQTSLEATPDSSDGSWLQDEVPELPAVKKRGHTISVMSPATTQQREVMENKNKRGMGKDQQGGINPSFVFLQLFHSHSHLVGHDHLPILLPQTEAINRAVKMLDHIHPYETHKIGVIYVGPGQATDEKAILSNMYGSERYVNFIQCLGELISLKDVDQDRVFLGGLELGADGQFAYSWQDESMQVIFHVATLMPNRESDPNCNAKKLHIGNDFVTIVYNDSGEDYTMGTIKGQFIYVNILIRPLDYETNAVTLQTKEVPLEFKQQITTDIAEILGHTDTKIISDANLAQLVRQIAMHCNLASIVLQRQQSQPQDPFASNWLERLRQIKRIHQKVQQEESCGQTPTSPKLRSYNRTFMEDFTDYV